MFSYSSSVFFCLGLFLVFSDVQAGVKSPYRKTDDLTSGEKADHSGEFREYSKSSLDQIKENITQMSLEFKTLKELLTQHVKHVNHTLETHASCRGHGNDHNDLGHYPADRNPSGSGGYNPGGSGGSRPGGPSGQGGSRPGRPGRPTAFTRPPIVRNPDEFDYAICKIRSNSKASSNVSGVVLLQQKKNSPTLYVILRVTGFDVSSHGGPGGHGDPDRSGPLTKPQKPERLQDIGQAREDFSQQLSKIGKNQKIIENGHSHALRVHERPDISGGCAASGSVYNPQNLRGVKPLGDLGDIECDQEGVTYMVISDETASLRGQYSIAGKPLVIHRNAGDSSSANDESDCLACCIIEKIPSSIYNTYVFPKGPSDSQNCAYSSETHGHYVSGHQREYHHHSHGSGVYPSGGHGSGAYPGGRGSGAYPGGQGSGAYPGGQGSGGRGQGGYSGGEFSGNPGGSGAYPGGSGGYRPGYGGGGSGPRPGGNRPNQPINQGGHDIGAGHLDNDDHHHEQVAQQKH